MTTKVTGTVLANSTVGMQHLAPDLSANVENISVFANTNSASGTSNVFFIGSPTAPQTLASVFLYKDGLKVSTNDFILHTSNNTVQLKEGSPAGGTSIDMHVWHIENP